MPSVMITGASRGIGLECARQFAEGGWRVYATCRDPFEAGELRRLDEQLDHISMHRLDVTAPAQVATLARGLPTAKIDVLLHSAGVWLDMDSTLRIGKLRFEDWEETMQVNVLGPARVTDAMIEQVARSDRRLVVGISSDMGCVSNITSPGSYAYRASKAGMNAMFHGMAHELRRRDVGVLLLHPGWVRTAMGGESATLSPAESAKGLMARIEEFSMEQTGKIYSYNGRELKW